MQQHPPRQRLRSNALVLSDGVQRSFERHLSILLKRPTRALTARVSAATVVLGSRVFSLVEWDEYSVRQPFVCNLCLEGLQQNVVPRSCNVAARVYLENLI